MGLFFNTCDNCRRWIPRSATFCRYCGGPNDTGWVKCWSCGAQISPASKHCHKCGVDQKDQRAVELTDGRWPRQDEDIALKVETSDLRGFIKKELDIEQGTEAALFQHGRLVGVVGPGRYTADSIFKRITPLAKVPTTILLYDASDREITVETDGLRTSDGAGVSATYKVTLRLTDAANFFENLFKGRRSLKLPALAERISDELRAALKGAVVGKTLAEVFEAPDFRASTEQALRKATEPVLARYGMSLAQLAFIDFFSPDYEVLADKKGELAQAIRQGDIDLEKLKITQRLRRTMSREKMETFSSEQEFADFVRQTEHELGMKDVIRADEIAKLKAGFGRKLEKDALLHEIEVRKVRHDADIDEAMKAQDLSRRARELAREDERERLAIRSQATAEALLSITDGPAADRLARLAELERKEKLSPEQLLAIAAAASPEAAAAYAREKGLKGHEEVLKRQEELHSKYTDRMERIMRTAMEQMGLVTASAARAAPGAPACPKCSGIIAPGAVFCWQCGKKLR
ncbi:MAG: SPFH domain-containing protein [Planctomycetota bacterium]|jgi:hypothetical protein